LFPIAIEIAYRYRERTSASAEVGGTAEITCAISQQDRHVVCAVVAHGEVLLAIPIEIAHRYRERKTAES